MDILQAKNLVIEAGHRLVENGLIARTWGNVSCRVSDKQFVITPSGKPYDGLKPEDIVLVNIEDLEYEGDVKPSSEKGIHAVAYRLRPEVNFVIHTHQDAASVVGALGEGMTVSDPETVAVIGGFVPLASYGLPGTKKLRSGVETAVAANPSSKAFLMAHHGALCLGADCEESFLIAGLLERECMNYFFKKSDADSFSAAAAKFFGVSAEESETASSKREAGRITIVGGKYDGSVIPLNGTPGEELPPLAAMHKAIYLARPEINYIIHSATPEIMAACADSKALLPLLDDYAQIAGASVLCIDKTSNPVKALKGRSAVLVKGCGVLCCGTDESDAQAIRMVLDKNCKTFVGQKVFGVKDYISSIEARLMRLIYVKKYSKQAQK